MSRSDGVQVDKGGFVRIHNTILEVLAKAHLRGQQYKLILFLFRKTYGYNLKENKISLKEWADGTNMQRQNVWRELHLLVEWNVIYMKSNGEKRPAIWGFNKYFEQWNLPSVITDDDKSVITCDDTLDVPVITDDYSEEKSVITPSHTRGFKDSKDKLASLLTPTDEENSKALVVQAYQTVCKIGPPMREEKGKAALVVALGLIEKFGYEACIRSLATLKERYYAALDKNQRRGIDAPLPYLRSIMEGIEESPRFLAPATVDFALEDITQ